jgi:hypothetical protein
MTREETDEKAAEDGIGDEEREDELSRQYVSFGVWLATCGDARRVWWRRIPGW